MLAAKGGFKTSKTFVYRLLKKALVVPMYIRWGGNILDSPKYEQLV
jgi:hypothetical protein